MSSGRARAVAPAASPRDAARARASFVTSPEVAQRAGHAAPERAPLAPGAVLALAERFEDEFS